MIREYLNKSHITDKVGEERLLFRNRVEAETISARYPAAELKAAM